eukprot:CAMPEP_0113881978 /NCGR_PEP_ID=MMETSP0780_2-20120614/8685_1 /TAXON_ID=652834 /ORGANISM="Palpitomonas bilix" /LENGTH=539 /DNA_ID=CAMNT_0000868913 /DNA_START=141 /DNA_END=1760 /DNA_ORIENTATION=- /assembly_acc=CAM_ASM_000599
MATKRSAADAGLEDRPADDSEMNGEEGAGEEEVLFTPSLLKKTVAGLRQQYEKNQMLRAKFADDPSKYLESELKLDEELLKLKSLSATPNLYPNFVELEGATLLIEILNHENVDVCVDAIDLLSDLTEGSVLEEELQHLPEKELEHPIPSLLLRSLGESGIADTLRTTLSRLLKAEREAIEKKAKEGEGGGEEEVVERQAVYNLFSVIESILESAPSLAPGIGKEGKVIEQLLRRINHAEFDQNSVYASELLAILVQAGEENRKTMVEEKKMELLLRFLSKYRKKEPGSEEEEEVLDNTVDALCALLTSADVQQTFLKVEGLELLLALMEKKKGSRRRALKILDFALTNFAPACSHFVSIYGIRTLSSLFMGKGLSSKKGMEKENEEHALSTLASLFKSLEGAQRERLVAKFFESEYEKMDRLMELWEKYSASVKKVDVAGIEQTLGEDEDKEEAILLAKMDQGLFCLQLIAVVIGYLLTAEGKATEALHYRAQLHLHQLGQSLNTVALVLVEYAESVGEDGYRASILTIAEELKKKAE